MQPTAGKLSIQCVDVSSEYVLRFEGVDWSESFPSIEAAIRRAGDLVVEETKVVVYDTEGRGVVATTLFPLESTLRDRAAWAAEVLGHTAETTVWDQMKTSLATEGVRGAIRFLNALTPHRFTSILRLEGRVLKKVAFYDRENPELAEFADIPLEASYCMFVRETSNSFVVEDAMQDDRVMDHPARGTINRYCGVPLLDPNGKTVGTVCHFDLVPGPVAASDVKGLERLSQFLRESLELLLAPREKLDA